MDLPQPEWHLLHSVSSQHQINRDLKLHLCSPSQLVDYTTKRSYEIDHFPIDFKKYPNMASRNIQFKRCYNVAECNIGAIFDDGASIKEIEASYPQSGNTWWFFR